MPVHPAEENAGGSITDKVAKESSDSTASSHQIHESDNANKATSGGQIAAEAHKANPVRSDDGGLLSQLAWRAGLINRQGPVHADNLPAPASKEELKKRAEELNK